MYFSYTCRFSENVRIIQFARVWIYDLYFFLGTKYSSIDWKSIHLALSVLCGFMYNFRGFYLCLLCEPSFCLFFFGYASILFAQIIGHSETEWMHYSGVPIKSIDYLSNRQTDKQTNSWHADCCCQWKSEYCMACL